MKIMAECEVDVKGLLCCAFEGGSNYWYEVESVDYGDYEEKDFNKGGCMQEEEYWHPYEIIPLADGCKIKVIARGYDCEPTSPLCKESIEKGLKIMQQKYPKHFADVLADHADAITGDVFLQCCVFGDVVFG